MQRGDAERRDACGCEFQGEWIAVQAPADVGDEPRVGGCQRKGPVGRCRPLREQRDGGGCRDVAGGAVDRRQTQRIQPVNEFPRDAHGGLAGNQQSQAPVA